MNADLCSVTPAQARRWLTSWNQPSADLTKVRYLYTAIMDGRWNPELHRDHPVAVRRDGYLVQGTHRLLAIVLADRPANCWTIDLSAPLRSA